MYLLNDAISHRIDDIRVIIDCAMVEILPPLGCIDIQIFVCTRHGGTDEQPAVRLKIIHVICGAGRKPDFAVFVEDGIIFGIFEEFSG